MASLLDVGTLKAGVAVHEKQQLFCVLQVPITLYLMTHAYFCFYHALSNVILRRVSHACHTSTLMAKFVTLSVTVFVLAFITALMETVTIAHFPYYRFKVRLLLLHACMHKSACPIHTGCRLP